MDQLLQLYVGIDISGTGQHFRQITPSTAAPGSGALNVGDMNVPEGSLVQLHVKDSAWAQEQMQTHLQVSPVFNSARRFHAQFSLLNLSMRPIILHWCCDFCEEHGQYSLHQINFRVWWVNEENYSKKLEKCSSRVLSSCQAWTIDAPSCYCRKLSALYQSFGSSSHCYWLSYKCDPSA